MPSPVKGNFDAIDSKMDQMNKMLDKAISMQEKMGQLQSTAAELKLVVDTGDSEKNVDKLAASLNAYQKLLAKSKTKTNVSDYFTSQENAQARLIDGWNELVTISRKNGVNMVGETQAAEEVLSLANACKALGIDLDTISPEIGTFVTQMEQLEKFQPGNGFEKTVQNFKKDFKEINDIFAMASMSGIDMKHMSTMTSMPSDTILSGFEAQVLSETNEAVSAIQTSREQIEAELNKRITIDTSARGEVLDNKGSGQNDQYIESYFQNELSGIKRQSLRYYEEAESLIIQRREKALDNATKAMQKYRASGNKQDLLDYDIHADDYVQATNQLQLVRQNLQQAVQKDVEKRIEREIEAKENIRYEKENIEFDYATLNRKTQSARGIKEFQTEHFLTEARRPKNRSQAKFSELVEENRNTGVFGGEKDLVKATGIDVSSLKTLDEVTAKMEEFRQKRDEMLQSATQARGTDNQGMMDSLKKYEEYANMLDLLSKKQLELRAENAEAKAGEQILDAKGLTDTLTTVQEKVKETGEIVQKMADTGIGEAFKKMTEESGALKSSFDLPKEQLEQFYTILEKFSNLLNTIDVNKLTKTLGTEGIQTGLTNLQQFLDQTFKLSSSLGFEEALGSIGTEAGQFTTLAEAIDGVIQKITQKNKLLAQEAQIVEGGVNGEVGNFDALTGTIILTIEQVQLLVENLAKLSQGTGILPQGGKNETAFYPYMELLKQIDTFKQNIMGSSSGGNEIPINIVPNPTSLSSTVGTISSTLSAHPFTIHIEPVLNDIEGAIGKIQKIINGEFAPVDNIANQLFKDFNINDKNIKANITKELQNFSDSLIFNRKNGLDLNNGIDVQAIANSIYGNLYNGFRLKVGDAPSYGLPDLITEQDQLAMDFYKDFYKKINISSIADQLPKDTLANYSKFFNRTNGTKNIDGLYNELTAKDGGIISKYASLFDGNLVNVQDQVEAFFKVAERGKALSQKFKNGFFYGKDYFNRKDMTDTLGGATTNVLGQIDSMTQEAASKKTGVDLPVNLGLDNFNQIEEIITKIEGTIPKLKEALGEAGLGQILQFDTSSIQGLTNLENIFSTLDAGKATESIRTIVEAIKELNSTMAESNLAPVTELTNSLGTLASYGDSLKDVATVLRASKKNLADAEKVVAGKSAKKKTQTSQVAVAPDTTEKIVQAEEAIAGEVPPVVVQPHVEVEPVVEVDKAQRANLEKEVQQVAEESLTKHETYNRNKNSINNLESGIIPIKKLIDTYQDHINKGAILPEDQEEASDFGRTFEDYKVQYEQTLQRLTESLNKLEQQKNNLLQSQKQIEDRMYQNAEKSVLEKHGYSTASATSSVASVATEEQAVAQGAAQANEAVAEVESTLTQVGSAGASAFEGASSGARTLAAAADESKESVLALMQAMAEAQGLRLDRSSFTTIKDNENDAFIGASATFTKKDNTGETVNASYKFIKDEEGATILNDEGRPVVQIVREDVTDWKQGNRSGKTPSSVRVQENNEARNNNIKQDFNNTEFVKSIGELRKIAVAENGMATLTFKDNGEDVTTYTVKVESLTSALEALKAAQKGVEGAFDVEGILKGIATNGGFSSTVADSTSALATSVDEKWTNTSAAKAVNIQKYLASNSKAKGTEAYASLELLSKSLLGSDASFLEKYITGQEGTNTSITGENYKEAVARLENEITNLKAQVTEQYKTKVQEEQTARYKVNTDPNRNFFSEIATGGKDGTGLFSEAGSLKKMAVGENGIVTLTFEIKNGETIQTTTAQIENLSEAIQKAKEEGASLKEVAMGNLSVSERAANSKAQFSTKSQYAKLEKLRSFVNSEDGNQFNSQFIAAQEKLQELASKKAGDTGVNELVGQFEAIIAPIMNAKKEIENFDKAIETSKATLNEWLNATSDRYADSPIVKRAQELRDQLESGAYRDNKSNSKVGLQASMKEIKAGFDSLGTSDISTIVNELTRVFDTTNNAFGKIDASAFETLKTAFSNLGIQLEDYDNDVFKAIEANEKLKESLTNVASSPAKDMLKDINKKISGLESKELNGTLSQQGQQLLEQYRNLKIELEQIMSDVSSGKLNGETAFTKITEDIKKAEQELQNFNAQYGATGNINAAGNKATAAFQSKLAKWGQNNSNALNDPELAARYKALEFNPDTVKLSVNQLKEYDAMLSKLDADTRRLGKGGLSFGDQMKKRMSSLKSYFATYFSVFTAIQKIREAVNTVKELDSAFVEMRKVSNESEGSLKSFAEQSFDMGDKVGTTGMQMQQSAADWMRLGESLNEAKKSAEVSNILLNVSEFENINDATESLVSMSQAYKDLDKMQIVDKLNNVGNNFSISTNGLAESLQTSAAALKTQGNDLDEAIALTTAGNAIVQNPSQVGAGLRMISLRIAGTEEAKQTLADAGENTEDYVVQTSAKKQAEIKHLTATASNGGQGVDILDSNGNFRSTYEILRDISGVYKEIQQEDKKYGTNRASALAEALAGIICLYCQEFIDSKECI